MNITEGNLYEMNNVLSYRRKLTELEMKIAIKDMQTFIEKIGAKPTGPVVRASFQMTNGVADVELMIPIDRVPTVFGNYDFKPVFRLKNALRLEYNGNYSDYPDAVKQLSDYMLNNKLIPTTVGYTIEKNMSDKSVKKMYYADTYVGISENIL